MATVDGLTKARMLAIEAGTVVDGEVDVSGHLFLTRHDGTIIDAGNVVGPTGPPAPSFGSGGAVNNDTAKYIRIAQVDGLNDSNGAQMVIDFTGGQNFGQIYNYSATIHFNQRGANLIRADVYEETQYNKGIVWYTRKLSTYVYELWVYIPAWAGAVKVEPRQKWHGEVMYDPIQTTAPSPLSTSTVFVHNASLYLETETVVDAVLPAAYRGGPTQVKINGVLSSETYDWLTPYIPGASRTVKLKKIGSTWYITGQDQKGYYSLPINRTNWQTYAESTASTVFSTKARATRLSSGIVSLSGLLRSKGSPANGSVIATLPVGCRPDTPGIFSVEHGNLPRAINIYPSGEITVRGGGWSANEYLSLDGIHFPAAGVATWTNFGSGGSSWGANFSSDALFITDFGFPAFWKDPYGFVWFRGLVKLTATVSANNSNIVTLPSTHRSYLEQHYRGVGLDGYAGLGAQSDNGLNWKIGSPGAANSWISLAGITILTNDAWANNPWFTPDVYPNSWSNLNPASYPKGSYLLREDGLCVASGLMANGTMDRRGMSIPDEEMWPRHGRIIIATTSGQARGRLDISGARDLGGEHEPGSLVFTQGSNAWYSLDNVMWVP